MKKDLFLAAAMASANHAWIEMDRPLTALALNKSIAEQIRAPTPPGGVLQLPPLLLPIGAEIRSISCVAEDIPIWHVFDFLVGVLNLVNPCGSSGGVNLSAFDPRAQRQDRLAPFILCKTKVDVQVSAKLVNGGYLYGLPRPPEPVISRVISELKLTRDILRAPSDSVYRRGYQHGQAVEAVFHGFSLNAFQEEQVCAIQTRIEPTDRVIGGPEIMHHFRKRMSSLMPSAHYYSHDPLLVKIRRAQEAGIWFGRAVKAIFDGKPPYSV